MKARLYYEAHLTVDTGREGKPLVPAWDSFKAILGDRWKVSRFDEDEVDGYDGKWFASMRGEIMHAVEEEVADAVTRLQGIGFKVLRAKIEDTLLDTKHGDMIGGIRL